MKLSSIMNKSIRLGLVAFTICLLGLIACSLSSQPVEIRMTTVEGINDGLKHVFFRALGQDDEAIKCSGHIRLAIYDTASGQEKKLLYSTEFDIHPGDYEPVKFPGFTYPSKRQHPPGYIWQIPMTDIEKSSNIAYGQDEMVQAKAELIFTTPQGEQFEASEVTDVFGTLATWQVNIGEATVSRIISDWYPWMLSIPVTITNTGEVNLTDLMMDCDVISFVPGSEAVPWNTMCASVIQTPAPNVDYISKGASKQVTLDVYFGDLDLYSSKRTECECPSQEYSVRVEIEVTYYAVGRPDGCVRSATKDISFALISKE